MLLALAASLLTGAPAHAARSTEQVSGSSPTGSYADYGGVSTDGLHVVFVTSKPLDPADTDSQNDVYDNSNGVNTLVSIGSSGGNGPHAASFDSVSQSGSTVIFETGERLTPQDTDDSRDVYSRSGSTTSLVSPGTGAYDAFFEGASSDGTKVFFGTNESLLPADTDTYFDGYMGASGSATLMTTGPSGGNGSFPAEFTGASADGTHMFFDTREQLVSADTDDQIDVYERTGGTTSLVSIGPSGGNGSLPATYDGCSTDGTKVFFSTSESLVSADSGAGEDIYRRSGGTTSIMTGPTFGTLEEYVGNSTDGNHAYYQTVARETAADLDSFIDVYDSNNGSISLVSPGFRNNQGAANAYFAGAADDGSHIFIRNEEQLVTADSDNTQDIYDVSGGTATLVSIGPAGGNASATATYAGTSQNGTRVFFETYESLVAGDTDATIDVYERSAGTTTLLSSGSTGGNGLADAHFRGSTPDGNRVFLRTGESLVAGDTDASDDIYSSSLPGQVVIVKNAIPDDPQDFTFTIGGGLTLGLPAPPGQTTFQLDDDADPTLSNTQTFTNVPMGSGYSVTESPAAGWDPETPSCSNGSPAGNIRVDSGQTTTCTFANDKRGKIVVVLDSQPDAPQDFYFTAGGGLTPTSFQLDDDADPTLSNTQTFADVVPSAGYSVAESVPGTWDLTSSTCSDGSPITNIDVAKGETVTCTFVNKKRGKIVVVKDAQPDGAQDFSFTAGGGLSPASFQLDDDADPTLSNTQTFTNVVPASGYSISETVPSGWDQSSATCDNGNPVTNISVAVGQTVTCTFTNRKRGQLVVNEDSQPDDPQDFSFSAGGGLSPSSFSLDDDSDGTLSNTRTFSNLVPGSGYSIAQGAAPSGWDLSSSTCDDGSALTAISVSAGETVTCTFVNKKRGSLVVVKDAVPNDGQNFTFTAGGGLSPTSFQLDDDNNPQLSNTQTFSNIQAKSGYSISEAAVSGWYTQSATCSNGSSISNIDIGAGQTVTCTFVNNKVARITVVKDAQPDDAQDFAFTATGLAPSSFSLDDDTNPTLSNTRVYDNLNAGTGYAVSETAVAGWDLTSATCSDGSPFSNIDLSPGEQITCTFVNKKRGSITIAKDAQPDDPLDFSFTAGGGLSPTSFQLDDDADPTLSNTRTFSNLPSAAGYSVSEAATSGWTQSSSCSDGSAIGNIDVAPGESVTCTFTNKRNGTIVAVKDAQPDDPQDFAFSAGGGLSPSSFSLDDDTDPALSNTRTFSGIAPKAGYSLSETVPSGWDQSSATCSDGSPVANIDVAPNETVTCSFTNRKRGSVVLVEDSQPNDPQDFAFTAGGGLSPGSFSLDDDSDPALSNTQTFNNVVPASGYSISETVPSGWDQTTATCDNGNALGNITVAAGQTVTCTVTNRKRGQVVVVKDAVPNDPQDFSFTAGGGLSPASFSLDDDSDPTLSNTLTLGNVVPGAGYSLAETVPSGWDQTSASCDDGSALSSIDVAAGETVTCTFVNTKRAQLTITKDAQPNAPQDFAFTAGGGLSPTSFLLDDDADPVLSNTRTFSNVTPGTYSVNEGALANWDLHSATCDDGSPTFAIALAPGEQVSCTFTNLRHGSLVVVEASQPNDPQDFSFTAGGGLSPSSFSLDDDSDGTLSNTRTFSNISSGTYSLAETVPGGWDLSSATCSDGSPVASIDIAPNETVTCTFTNDKRGQIVVNEDSQPDDPQDFSFSAGGGLSPSSFSLDDDSDGTLANTRTFADVVPGSGYSLDETVPGGWDLGSATCDDGSPVSDIDVAAGETVTCSFTNSRRGKIVAVKDAVPNGPRDFSFTAGGGLSPASFQLDDDSDPTLSNTRTFSDVVPGDGYSLDETVPAGWDQTSASCSDGSPVSDIDLAQGETVTCTFVNTKRTQLTIIKDAQPDHTQDFDFTTGGGLSPSSFSLDDDSDPTLSNTLVFADVVPGTYSVSEGAAAGWDLSSATCTDGSPVSAIALAPGENVTCTFTNRERSGLVVVESSDPNDPQDFSFSAGGGLSPSSFSLDDDSDGTLSNTRTFASIQSGTYSLAETVPSGWDLSSATCDDGSPVSAVDVAPGETVTCTFANAKRGKLVVNEDSQPNDPQDFSFSAGGGLSPSSFSLDDDSDGTLSNTRTFASIQSGNYSLAETVPSGWDLSSATCDDGSAVSSIDVAPGETVTCSFTNRKRGRIVVVKDAQPNDPQDFGFSAGGGLSPASFSLDDDSDPALSNTRTFTNVVPGSGYSIDETEPNGWDQTSSTCDDGGQPSSIDVAAGETVTCTFVNTKRASLTIVKDAHPNDAQDFSFTTGGGLSPASFQLDDDSDPTLSNSETFTGLTPGTYSVNESAVTGWDLSSATCDDSSPTSAISLSAGEDVTCTFTNSQRGQLTVVEDSVPDDPQDFSFTAGGGLSPSSFQLDDDSDPTLSNTRTFANISTGTYSISETVPGGWGIDSATCDDGSPVSSVDVGPGETVTCTITNKKSGKIVAVKDAQPNDAQDFSFAAGGGLSPTGFQLDDDSDPTLSNARTFTDVTPGSGYALSETVPGGWDQTGASCDDGSPPSNIAVSAGETVTCTFTNRQRGKIVVVKDTQPNDPQDFTFSAGGGLSPSSFQLDDDGDATLSNTRTFTNVVPQAGYSVAETVPASWIQASATCSDGSPPTNIDVASAETVTCTFVNVHGYPRPKGASPLRASLVPAFTTCASPDTIHGAPLSSPSCRPPVQASSYLTVGSPDTNGKSANMIGAVVAHAVIGIPNNGTDEADIRFDISLSDVRNKSDLSDYTGALATVTSMRATDRYNGAALDEPGTVTDFPFSITVPCTATSVTTTGSNCAITTTADAVTSGTILEVKRTIWQFGDVQVFDGGADGNPSTAPNSLFARQGVFLP